MKRERELVGEQVLRQRRLRVPGVDREGAEQLVRDGVQGKGLGTELYRQLLKIARDEKLDKVHSNMLRENIGMITICRKLGFHLTDGEHDDNLILAELPL